MSNPLVVPNKYVYEPIKETDGFIRVIELLPAQSYDDPLRCVLHQVQFDKHPYEAISYVWGSEVPSESLHVDQSILKITKNLCSALKHFRQQTGSRYLWADAICIDQQNSPEKSNQVAIMGNIYANAVGVLCWIGGLESALYVFLIMSFLKDMALIAEKYGIDTVDAELELAGPVFTGSIEEAREVLEEARENHLHHLYGNPFFSRLWIVQEVVLAAKLTVCSDLGELEWPVFATATKLIYAAESHIAQGLSTSSLVFQAYTLIAERAKYRLFQGGAVFMKTPYWEHGHLVQTLKKFNCKLDHDRIYALLSLSARNSVLQLKPDYARPVTTVFTDFARAYVFSQDVQILHDAGLHDRLNYNEVVSGNIVPGNEHYLPSWVPDYRTSCIKNTFLPWQDHENRNRHGLPTVHIRTEPSHKIMVHGTVIDYVETSVAVQGDDVHHPDNIRNWVLSCIQLAGMEKEHIGLAVGSQGTVQPIPLERSLKGSLASVLLAGGLDPVTRSILLDKPDDRDFGYYGFAYSTEILDSEKEFYQQILQYYSQKKSEDDTTERFVPNPPSSFAAAAFRYHIALQTVASGCSFVKTERGLNILAPRCVQKGDLIFMVDGMYAPVVVRTAPQTPQPQSSLQGQDDIATAADPPMSGATSGIGENAQPEFHLLGTCYVDGFRPGEIDLGGMRGGLILV